MIRKAFSTGQSVVIWNEAATGAGKTLANFSYLTEDPGINALGVYPVNELIKDQYESLSQAIKLNLGEEFDVWSSEELREKREEGETTIEQLIKRSGKFTRVILTNPDYVQLILQQRLFSPLQGDKIFLAHHIATNYRLQIFDEFHLYNIAQMNMIAQWMAWLVSFYQNQTFVFVLSSATPNPLFETLLERAGIPIWRVKEAAQQWENEYVNLHETTRTFLESIQLDVVGNALQNWNTAERIQESWESFEEQYIKKYPTAKGLIILDSLYEAQRLASFLREKGYDVGEVHGVAERKKGKSREALGKQITVATATVEVGVDFKGDIHKDYMIFEARNPGSFMQRLGRLGRGNRVRPEPPLHVTAYVPHYVANYLLREDGTEITRDQMKQLVMDAYRPMQTFLPFVEKVGAMQLVHAEKLLAAQFMSNAERDEQLAPLRDMIERMYDLSFAEQEKRYGQFKKERILEPLLSFRGQNTLEFKLYIGDEQMQKQTFHPDIWFWDEQASDFPLKCYDYAYVLRRREVQFVEKEELLRRLQKYAPDRYEESKQAMERHPVLAYAITTGMRDKAARLYWNLDGKAMRSIKENKVMRYTGLYLDSDDPALSDQLHFYLRPVLRDKSWIAYILRENTYEVQEQWKLPPMFRLYEARISNGKKFSIAFNIEAFKLWSICEGKKSEFI